MVFCDSLIFDSDIDSGIIAYDNIQVKTVDGVVISSDSLVYSLQSNSGRFLAIAPIKNKTNTLKALTFHLIPRVGRVILSEEGCWRQGHNWSAKVIMETILHGMKTRPWPQEM